MFLPFGNVISSKVEFIANRVGRGFLWKISKKGLPKLPCVGIPLVLGVVYCESD